MKILRRSDSKFYKKKFLKKSLDLEFIIDLPTRLCKQSDSKAA